MPFQWHIRILYWPSQHLDLAQKFITFYHLWGLNVSGLTIDKITKKGPPLLIIFTNHQNNLYDCAKAISQGLWPIQEANQKIFPSWVHWLVSRKGRYHANSWRSEIPVLRIWVSRKSKYSESLYSESLYKKGRKKTSKNKNKEAFGPCKGKSYTLQRWRHEAQVWDIRGLALMWGYQLMAEANHSEVKGPSDSWSTVL